MARPDAACAAVNTGAAAGWAACCPATTTSVNAANPAAPKVRDTSAEPFIAGSPDVIFPASYGGHWKITSGLMGDPVPPSTGDGWVIVRARIGISSDPPFDVRRV